MIDYDELTEKKKKKVVEKKRKEVVVKFMLLEIKEKLECLINSVDKNELFAIKGKKSKKMLPLSFWTNLARAR